jgi:hypothetical protein
MLTTLSQLAPAHIAFLILVAAVFTVYPAVLAFAYAATGRDHLKRRRRSAPAAVRAPLSQPRDAMAA